MKEHHHLELLTIDYDMLDILSVPYGSPYVSKGKWRAPVTKKNSFMMQDAVLATKERASSFQVMKNQIPLSEHKVNTI